VRKFFLVMFLFLVPAVGMAQNYSQGRAQTWDFSLGAIYQQGDSAGGNGGSSLDVDDAWGIGFNVGYNFTDHLNLSADFDFLRPDFTAVVIVEPDPPDGSQTTALIDHHLSQFNGRLKGTFYLMDGPFMPYIEAGLGWSYIDSNVQSGGTRILLVAPVVGLYLPIVGPHIFRNGVFLRWRPGFPLRHDR